MGFDPAMGSNVLPRWLAGIALLAMAAGCAADDSPTEEAGVDAIEGTEDAGTTEPDADPPPPTPDTAEEAESAGSDGGAPVAAPTGDVACVMNGSVGGGWATTYLEAPVQRVPLMDWETNAQIGWSYSNKTAASLEPGATEVTVDLSPTAVFLDGPAGNVGLSIDDGGTYDFDDDGMGARVTDTREATRPDIPEASVDLTVTCE